MGLPNVNMLPNVNIMQANLPNVDCKKPLSTLGKQLFTINIRQVYLPNVNIRQQLTLGVTDILTFSSQFLVQFCLFVIIQKIILINRF